MFTSANCLGYDIDDDIITALNVFRRGGWLRGDLDRREEEIKVMPQTNENLARLHLLRAYRFMIDAQSLPNSCASREIQKLRVPIADPRETSLAKDSWDVVGL